MPQILIVNDPDRYHTIYPDALVLNIDDSTLSSLIQAPDRQQLVRDHLLRLSIPQTRKGFNYLSIGILLFAQDPEQLLSKELYPAIANAAGCGSTAQVERSIRTAILSAWQQRNASAWDQYFPGTSSVPTNKHFLCTIAQMIR